MNKTQQTGLVRGTTDKYYTSSNCANLCINIFKENVLVTNNDILIEPSAGDGVFIELLKSLSPKCFFYDIEPNHIEVQKQDYLDFHFFSLIPASFITESCKIHVLGNPPFGRQSSLAIKFIKKSCEFCDTLSFILPKSFKKESMKRHFPLLFHLKKEVDILPDSFLVNNRPHNVPCVFQIWEKQTTPRVIPTKLTPKGFKFVKKTENPHISFRRVGVYAGKVETNSFDKSEQSHYFIRFIDISLSETLITALNSIDYETKDNTVGPRSISKQELIENFNFVMNKV